MSTGPVVVRACDVEEPDARAMEAVEAAYRRGVHQALAFAYNVTRRSGRRREVEERLGGTRLRVEGNRRAESQEPRGYFLAASVDPTEARNTIG
jgi:hypothetical protein